MADVVIVGGGPIGLWSAIQLKKRLPALGVRVYERHEVYQRSHVLRLDHWSLILYAAASRTPAERQFIKDVTGKSLTGMRTTLARSLYIRTNEFEGALQRYARELGIEVCIARIEGARHARELHPECSLFVAADGAHSSLRSELFGDDAMQSTTLQYLLELKCEEHLAGEAPRVPRLNTAKLWRLNRNLHHTGAEYVGRVKDGVAPVTLRLFLSPEEYSQLPAMSFKTPHLLGTPGLPASIEEDLQTYLATRSAQGCSLVEGSARVTRLELNMYTSRRFACMQDDAAWFLVGDAAMGVPYFRALNSGLMLASRLAQIVAKTKYPHEGDLATKVAYYDERYRPAHVATEFAIARGKNQLVEAMHMVREQFAQSSW